MKTKSCKFLFACLALMAMLFALAAPPELSAQVTPTTLTNAITGPITLNHTSTNITNGAEITVNQGKGLSIERYLIGAYSTNTGTIGLLFATTRDGTNYSTTTPIVVTSTVNGTTWVRDISVIPASSLEGLRKIKLLKVTNATDNIPGTVLTNVAIGKY